MPRAALPNGRGTPAQASPLRLALWIALMALVFSGFVALGNWQIERRAWKLDLMARVEQRVQAPPVAPPARSRWALVNAADDAYTRVCVEGRYRHDLETRVQAVTERGAGDWLLTPLQTATGEFVLINRGFVDPAHRLPATRAAAQLPGRVTVCGLLRISEPHGAFLRRNNSAEDRWFSRDVAAIAAARHLPASDVAPYFIDADATENPGGWPIGGLTVIRFHNSHLVYALTWYTLALMTLGGAVIVWRHSRRRDEDGV